MALPTSWGKLYNKLQSFRGWVTARSQELLNKVNSYPKLRRQIKAWLKAGVMDNGCFEETKAGTPQGGIISPLLANIALHGMEWEITSIIDLLRNSFFAKFSPYFTRVSDMHILITQQVY